MAFKPGRPNVEYRSYDIRRDFPVFAFLREHSGYPGLQAESEQLDFMHFHNMIEIALCHEGDGQAWIEDKYYRFSSGDAVIILPYATHFLKNRFSGGAALPCACEFFYFKTDWLVKPMFPGGFPYEDKFRFDSTSFNNLLQGEKHPLILRMIRQIVDELRGKKEGYETCIRGLLVALMVELSRIIPARSEQDEQRRRSIASISPAIHFLNENCAQSFGTDHLAQMCHLSPTHFRRTFRQIMGQSPLSYIHQMRINQCCTLLYTTEMTVLDISLAAGYESLSSFNRHFQAVMGEAPTKWRDKARHIKKRNLSYSSFRARTQDGPR